MTAAPVPNISIRLYDREPANAADHAAGNLLITSYDRAQIIHRRTVPLTKRFWKKVDFDGADGCWLWTAGTTHDGYGFIHYSVDPLTHRTVYAHRYAYEALVGPIPDGLQLDHLCRVRHCVNPQHLEAVSPRENIARSTVRGARAVNSDYCIRGHHLGDAYRTSEGSRQCRPCTQFRKRARARAIARLMELHSDEYEALLAEEQQR